MVERALVALEALLLVAGLSFIDKWMELLFLPSMGKLALLKALASLLVACNEGPTLPIFAELGLVAEKGRPSSEVLEVMRVYTLRLVMLVVVWAPLRLEVEYIEVEVRILWEQVMDQAHFDVVDRVSEGTILSILALLHLGGVTVAELSFVLVLVVKPLDSVMRAPTFVPFGTLFSVSELAQLGSVCAVVPPLVFDGMEIVAAFMVVRGVLAGTLRPLEVDEVQVTNSQGICRVECLREQEEVRVGRIGAGYLGRLVLRFHGGALGTS